MDGQAQVAAGVKRTDVAAIGPTPSSRLFHAGFPRGFERGVKFLRCYQFWPIHLHDLPQLWKLEGARVIGPRTVPSSASTDRTR